ncbi:efflux RND transporter periplasmic adaptor subunit [Bacteroides reticulotermitis]|uniref:HlyD family secretion protein n=2 Tax=Bacteroides reticulotermitis TaxID=1133319 RepID=W4V0G7_9BACE|nr:efflux RND transporter periplasmic adaptor subunit [Bacteroides reticulotermitis]MBB4046407.1 RND family efflux transporter MFP subunit [Bacteroides reticulotermitis]GAE86577.1 HlyD family secretion protein [Bacteroides reticulotermitis JCM 10512]
MKSKIVTPIIVTVSIVGLIAWKLVDNKQTIDRNAELSLTVNTVVPVMVEKPQYIDLSEKISVNGRIDSENEVAVYSKTQGIVIRKHKKAGDVVSRRTVIAQLENNVIRENLRLSELDLAKAKKDVERFQNLASIGAVTVRELEDAQITLRSIESRITDLQDQLCNTTITSPASGVINKDYFEEGTLLSVGSSVIDIVDNKALRMYANVTEKEVLKLKTGMEAVITTDVYPGSTFTGRIEAISPKSNDQYYYSVELVLNHQGLRPGMFATAIFNVDGNNRNTPVVSREAIVGGMKDPQVFVIRDSKAYKVAVQVGISDGEYIEITDGISPDDVVVKSGQINLIDGTEVSILNL